MKRQHIVVAYLKKSKRSNADGTETCAVFCIYSSVICIGEFHFLSSQLCKKL